jgi:hypothetical protein
VGEGGREGGREGVSLCGERWLSNRDFLLPCYITSRHSGTKKAGREGGRTWMSKSMKSLLVDW